MSFKIVHGGMIRKSNKISSSDSTAWTKGRLLTLNSSGEVIVHTGVKTTQGAATGYPIVGVALEDRVVSTAVGPTVTLTKVGAPTGDRASFVMDAAVITQDQNLESGITFATGNLLYISSNGKITTSGNSTGPNSPIIGAALSEAHSADPARPLTYLFKVTY